MHHRRPAFARLLEAVNTQSPPGRPVACDASGKIRNVVETGQVPMERLAWVGLQTTLHGEEHILLLAQCLALPGLHCLQGPK